MFELGLAIFILSCAGMFLFVIALWIHSIIYTHTKMKQYEEQD